MGAFISAIPGAVGLGLIWGIMAIGVYITFRVLDFADLTVDGTLATGGAVLVISMMNGMNVWVALLFAFLAGCMAGLVTGVLNTLLGIPPILAGILTQLALYSINLRILGKSNQALSIYKYHVLASMTDITKAIIIVAIFVVAIITILYWFFDTELGHSIRARQLHPCDRRERQHEPRAGHQRRFQQGARSDDLERSGRARERAVLPVSGLRRRQYGQRRYRYRSCRSYYRRGYLWQNI